MKYFWLAIALVLTGSAGIAVAQTDTRVAAAGLYSPIPKASPGIIKTATCSGKLVNNCAQEINESNCTSSYVPSSNTSSSGFKCAWSGKSCVQGSSC